MEDLLSLVFNDSESSAKPDAGGEGDQVVGRARGQVEALVANLGGEVENGIECVSIHK